MWRLVRLLLTAMLLATAAAKVLDSARILGSGGLLASPLRLSLVVGLEVFAAIVIATAPSRVAHRFGLIVFSIMACVAAWALWTLTDCDCFGARTPKGIPLVVDIIAIVLLLTCRPGADTSGCEDVNALRRRMIQSATTAITVGLLAAGATNWQAGLSAVDDEMPAWFGDDLIGLKMPLLRDKKFAAVVPASGETLVVMLRPDCEHCREVAGDWRESDVNSRSEFTLIGVSVGTNGWTVMPGMVSSVPVGTEDEFAIDWQGSEEPFVAAPTLIAVRDQVVVGLVSGDDASELIRAHDWVDQLFGHADE